ncbi:MAG: hypothetical protein IKC75_02105 [Clostridia bacterium]|nr:hypothetical protein [Clostridia bacterium]
MSKKRKKGGGISPLTLMIRLLIVVIFIASVIIAFNRITEAIHNDEKKKDLTQKTASTLPPSAQSESFFEFFV